MIGENIWNKEEKKPKDLNIKIEKLETKLKWHENLLMTKFEFYH